MSNIGLRRLARILPGLAICLVLEVQAEELTLRQVLSSPFPTSLVAAPNHGRLAWVQNAAGERNLWVAIGPDYEARQITHYQGDDGQELSALQFGPGANHVVYVRGGGPNQAGELPNPRSEPDGVQQSIWIIEAKGGEPHRLGEGSQPVISPDGLSVAFVKSGQVWIVPSVDEGKPRQLMATRGRAGSLRFSPDGKRLAFVSGRGDHSFIGVLDIEAEKVRYLDPGLALDQEPVWAPDGSAVAFIREPHERMRLPFGPRRSALPWSIRLADPSTGQGREIWRAEQGTGSAFHGVSANNQLLWAAGNRIVFPWEKSGWVQLYSVASKGGPAKALTSGRFEVEHVFLTRERDELLVSSNQDDLDRRHIWRVPVDGGPSVALTPGDDLEWSPVMTGDGSALAYLASGATTPAHARIEVSNESSRPLSPGSMPVDFPTGLVTPQQVVFSAADGQKIHAQLFVPTQRTPGEKHPAVVFFHGGSRRQMLLGWHYMGYYHHAYSFNQYMASRGYVVLSVNYRSGTGYGMAFREALAYGATGASEFNDVLGAGLYLRSRDDVDPERIALWGGSYGGYLTALGLSRASDLFAAGVDIHGVHDWNIVIRNFVPTYDAEAHDAFAKLAFESSPMASISGWRSPVLLIHGDDDRNVPFSESVDLAEALGHQGVALEQLVFPDEVHGFLLHQNWVSALESAADFLDRKLRSSAPVTNEP